MARRPEDYRRRGSFGRNISIAISIVLERRLERSKTLLRISEMSLAKISLQASFSGRSHFTNVFRRFVGGRPSGFRALL